MPSLLDSIQTPHPSLVANFIEANKTRDGNPPFFHMVKPTIECDSHVGVS